MLGWIPTMFHVEKRQLMFCQSLCNMPTKSTVKKINRVQITAVSCSKAKEPQSGLIPDIYYILVKHNLLQYFSSKSSCELIVNGKLSNIMNYIMNYIMNSNGKTKYKTTKTSNYFVQCTERFEPQLCGKQQLQTLML